MAKKLSRFIVHLMVWLFLGKGILVQSDPLNILFITADDMNASSVGVFGSQVNKN